MDESDDIRRQRMLIAALDDALRQAHGRSELFETHISWVLVAGDFAYKFKKAVRFDFLDFSTLEARRFYCQEELRLNSRLAPDIYLGVVAVCGPAGRPQLGGTGEPIEYCVKMRAFGQEALWTHRLRHRLITGGEIDELANGIARFHLAAASAPAHSPWGAPLLVQQVAHDNHTQISAAVRGQAARSAREVEAWTASQHERLAHAFADRKRCGHVRECHGDLHSGNILTLDGKAQAFDCIEFNESLRWIDVINDIAFIYMDLRFQGRHDLAARCLNRYLECSGDYEGVSLLRYYQVQRALVRCKVALLRMQQAGTAEPDAEELRRVGWHYLEYARKNIAPAPAPVMITHGFSGSGKSVFARHVVECTGALQLRSDVERKRLHGAPGPDAQGGALGTGLYGAQATEHTYARLLALTRTLVRCGMPVVVDAAFLKRSQRSEFRALAAELGVPFHIFDLRASEATMRARVERRRALGQDPSDAGAEVLAHQLQNHEPLSGEESEIAIAVDAEAEVSREDVQQLCDRAGLPRAMPEGADAYGG